jgi:hypothetical protein
VAPAATAGAIALAHDGHTPPRGVAEGLRGLTAAGKALATAVMGGVGRSARGGGSAGSDLLRKKLQANVITPEEFEHLMQIEKASTVLDRSATQGEQGPSHSSSRSVVAQPTNLVCVYPLVFPPHMVLSTRT